jgi:DNA-binding transcriptional LysR family regulator
MIHTGAKPSLPFLLCLALAPGYLMDLIRNMQTFACVAEELSYTSAARALDISTGAVSRLISELERHLATRLLQRNTRQIALTHAGRIYLARCRAILEALNAAEAEARSVHLQPAGRLKVRASPSLGRHCLIPAFKAYQKKHPQVQLALTLADSVSHSVADGFDAAILALPALRDSSFVGVQLGETYSVLCAAPAYLLVQPAVETPAELMTHAFVSGVTEWIDPVELELLGPECTERVQVKPALCVNSLAAVASALEMGMGIGVLPFHAAFDALQSGRLLRVLPDYRLAPLGIYALFASKLFLDAKVRTWLDHLKAFLADANQRQAAFTQLSERAVDGRE